MDFTCLDFPFSVPLLGVKASGKDLRPSLGVTSALKVCLAFNLLQFVSDSEADARRAYIAIITFAYTEREIRLDQ